MKPTYRAPALRVRLARALWGVLVIQFLASPALAQSDVYYPGPGGDWETRSPEQAGMDARLLNEAIEFAKANESRAPRNLDLNHYLSFGREPYGEAVGPFKIRGDLTGIVVRHGYT